ncbi:MAG: hypothetical protein K6F60_04715 [Eubacterium sp.]|nr:hypothetical protein [Eubacterium sp.]
MKKRIVSILLLVVILIACLGFNCEHYSGYTDYYETVTTQVPHTTTKCSICGATK